MQIDRIKGARLRRKLRVHKRVIGTPDRPRLSVFRSNRHMYVQVIDDIAGVTLASASTRIAGLKKTGNIDAAKSIGVEIAKQAMQVGIKAVRFDRNRFKYHGRVKALAMAAREAGLVF